MTQIKDRSLSMSQGELTEGGHGVSDLVKLANEEYHQPTGHESAPAPIRSGPQGEGASSYKAEGSQPIVARMSGHSVTQNSGAVTAQLDKGKVQTERPAGGPVVSNPSQSRFSGVQFKR